jgi:hypothetical protein
VNFGTRLWKVCIILVLLFLAAEVFLLRYWDKIVLMTRKSSTKTNL